MPHPLLVKENINKVIEEILHRLNKCDNQKKIEQFDFEFTEKIVRNIPQYKGKIEGNTSLRYDTIDGELLHNIVDFFYSDITAVSQEEFDELDTFLETVRSKLETEFLERTKNAIREKIAPLEYLKVAIERSNRSDEEKKQLTKELPDRIKEAYPIPLKVLLVELDNQEVDFIIRVNKLTPAYNIIDKVPSESIGSELLDEYKLTKKPLEEILALKKAMGIPGYENIVGVTCEKIFFNCTVTFSVDFSNLEENK